MSSQPTYLNLLKIIGERHAIPVDMLAIKTGTTRTHLMESLEKMEKIGVLEINNQEDTVKISNNTQLPTIDALYKVAG